MKKALIGTALAGTLVASAGFGTYSWFTAETTAKGDIQNYTLQLDNTKAKLFDSKKLAPGRTVSDEFTITNSGELEQKLRGQFKLSASKGVDFSNYIVTVKATYKDKNGVSHPGTVSGNGNQAINLAGKWLPTPNGVGELKSGESVTFKVDVKLAEKAGNEYQGVTVGGEATFQATQTDAGATFE